jgi:hypothetical protein
MSEAAKKENYGTMSIGYGSSKQQEIALLDYVRADFVDHRLVSIMTAEDDSIILAVENPATTGRAPQNLMRLSQESFVGLITTSLLYLSAKGLDLGVLAEQVVKNQQIVYQYSDNLQPADFTRKPTQEDANLERD